MCARFTLTADDKAILAEYNLTYADPFTPNYNVAITQETPVITADQPDIAQNMHFGIVPHFAAEPKLQGDTWNSRNDKLLESNLWRPLIKNVKTCLVLTTGFLEFKEISKKPGDKDPYMLKVLGRDIYAMAGLYSVWKSKETNEVYKSFSIITTDANPLMADIHWTKKRQPFILRKEHEKLWLDKGISLEDRMSLIDIFPEDEMQAIPLSRSINKVSTKKNPNNFAHLLEPVNSL